MDGKSLKEVCSLLGFESRFHVMRLEQKGICETPTERNKYGHLIYDDEHIDRLWAAKICMDLGYKPSEIKERLDRKDFNYSAFADEIILDIENKKRRLEESLTIAKAISTSGTMPSTVLSILPEAGRNDILAFLKVESNESFLEIMNKIWCDIDLDIKLLYANFINIFSLFSKNYPDKDESAMKIAEEIHKQFINCGFPSLSFYKGAVSALFTSGNSFYIKVKEKYGKQSLDYAYNIIDKYISSKIEFSVDIEFYKALYRLIDTVGEKLCDEAEQFDVYSIEPYVTDVIKYKDYIYSNKLTDSDMLKLIQISIPAFLETFCEEEGITKEDYKQIIDFINTIFNYYIDLYAEKED